MSGKTSKSNSKPKIKTVASMIREAIEKNGYKDVKECSRSIRVPYDLFNKVVGGHIPKDAQLVEYARKLKIDHRELILAAYREKAPDEMKRYFNSVMLLEDHKPAIKEMLELMDSFNSDQMEQLTHVARMIQSSPRDYCRKAIALLFLYQDMDKDTMSHFDSLVQLVLRKEDLKGLDEFRGAIDFQQKSNTGRRSRLHA
ncbi:MAG: hypothetical protein OEZ59_04520 [Deltaproteobacteria bacterium]|nr:hypothetical protein [Deltaproteobacteria bacterium]